MKVLDQKCLGGSFRLSSRSTDLKFRDGDKETRDFKICLPEIGVFISLA